MPPTALQIEVEMVANVGTNSSGSAHSDVFLMVAPGTALLQSSATPAAANQFDQDSRSGIIPNITAQTVTYRWIDVIGTANIANRSLWLRVLGYQVPNGG